MFDIFEKYDPNDMYLAVIRVRYSFCPEREECLCNVFASSPTGYGYETILLKQGDKFIDLKHPRRIITTSRVLGVDSYEIAFMNPLSKYHTPALEPQNTGYTKRTARAIASEYYFDLIYDCIQEMEKENLTDKTEKTM